VQKPEVFAENAVVEQVTVGYSFSVLLTSKNELIVADSNKYGQLINCKFKKMQSKFEKVQSAALKNAKIVRIEVSGFN